MRQLGAAVSFLAIVFASRCARNDAPALRFAPAAAIDAPRDIVTMGRLVPQAGSEVKIGPRISGRLAALHVRTVDPVRRGQLIAELDEGTLAAEVKRLAAELESARADEAYAEAVLQRTRRMHAAGLVPDDGVEAAQRDWKRSAAQRDAAHARLEEANVERGYTRVYSPIAGIVASVSTREGETVAASLAAPTFVTIVDVHRLELTAWVDELDVASLSAGQRVTFTVDALPDRVFEGRMRAINPQAVTRDNVTMFVANIDVTSDPGALRPDMTAEVTVDTGRRTRVVVVPQEAVVREGDDAFVFVRGGGGAEKRRVHTAGMIGGRMRVREGLAPGELVAINPGARQ